MGGLPSGKTGLAGPVGGGLSLPVVWPADTGLSSVRALGPVGGGFPVSDCISTDEGWRLGTEPKAGADGAMGGGEMSLAEGGGS